MSAIAVIFSLGAAPVAEQQLRSMTDAVSHRGPDGIGVWASGAVGLGVCLSKTTPQASYEQLPLVSEDGRYAVALDGRIDNRGELAKALKIDAASLAVLPDSEMLLSTYRKWGKRCLDHLTGDFAFAIWDSETQEVFCGRDPLGVRLLHYYCDGKVFFAATEVAQINSVIKTELNLDSLALFLEGRNLPADHTFLEGVMKVPGGCHLTASASGTKTETYWNPDPSDLLKLKDSREYEERFLELFTDSVRARLSNDKKVAVSLSGGMDSTSVIALAEYLRQSGSPELAEVVYYSNVYGDLEKVDESEYIRDVVSMYGTSGKMLESGSFEDKSLSSSPLGLKRAEPIIAPHEESHRLLFREAQKDGSRVLLTGDGGDEIFDVSVAYFADMIRRLDLRGVRREWKYFSLKLWRDAAFKAATSLIPFVDGEGDEEPSAYWLSEKARKSISLAFETEMRGARRFRSMHQQEVDGWIQVRGRMAGYTWSDVTQAEYDLEPRHPFLDRRLAEFMISVPPEYKFRFGYNKRLLRRSMKGILPESVRNRRYKTDFSSLFDVKATQYEASEITENFNSPKMADLGLVNPDALREAWASYQESANDTSVKMRTALWVAITLEQWLRQRDADDE